MIVVRVGRPPEPKPTVPEGEWECSRCNTIVRFEQGDDFKRVSRGKVTARCPACARPFHSTFFAVDIWSE